MNRLLLAAVLFLPPHLRGQATVTGIKIHTDPAGAHIRPFENAVVQVRVYGKVGNLEGRILKQGAKVTVEDSGGGWLSKPFKFQGRDDEAFIQQYDSAAGRIFQDLAGQYAIQDSFLYTAPETPGDYKLAASLDAHTASVTIRVDASASSSRKPERTSFPAEPASTDPYRDLVEHYSPFLAQETWFQPKADYPARFDYDGDWNGSNNWESLDTGTSQAYVHYAVMETASHWFLIYNVFHPLDYSDKCVAGSCHENDNEGLIVTVMKDGSKYGNLQVVETLAHNNIYSFVADDRIRKGAHDIDGKVELYQDSHPVVFIEAGGHGIYGSRSGHARFDLSRDRFTAGTGVTYIYKKIAERPKHPNDRLVGYELLDIYSQWWVKGNPDAGWRESTFDAFFNYQPLGGRPGVAFSTIAGSFLGRMMGQNLAKPFWGWHDNRTRKQNILGVGQWGLDPAYAVSKNLTFPVDLPFSTDYVFNPFLVISQAPPSILPPTGQAPGSKGWFEFRIDVDHAVEAFVSRDQFRLQVIAGEPLNDYLISFSEPLPAAPLRSARLVLKEGRGTAQLLEQPIERNGFTARVRIEDPQAGSATYHVALEWER